MIVALPGLFSFFFFFFFTLGAFTIAKDAKFLLAENED